MRPDWQLQPLPSPTRLRRAVFLVWTLLLAVLCMRCLLSTRANGVYPIFAAAARHWIDGTELYRPVAAYYRYSPPATVLFVPFSLLPDAVGGVLWRVINAGVYLLAFFWWSHTALADRLTPTQRAILWLLIVPLSVGSLNNGQSNALVVGLLLAAVTATLTERWNLASFCVALASLLKVYPLVVGLMLAWFKPHQLSWRLAIALLLGVGSAFLFQRPGYVLAQYAQWFHFLLDEDRLILAPEFWYRDVRLLWHAAGLPVNGNLYLASQLLTAAGIALLACCGRGGGNGAERAVLPVFGLCCCWMTILGPATESCTYILLAPVLAWTVLESLVKPTGRFVCGCLSASYVLFLLTQAAVWLPGKARTFHTLGPQPLAGLLLFVGLLCLAIRQIRAVRSNPGNDIPCRVQPAN